MTFGRTVEKTLPLALLIVYPSPGNVYPQAYGVHVTKQRQANGVHVTISSLASWEFVAPTLDTESVVKQRLKRRTSHIIRTADS
jgi:hypothetical protein